ncbi:hypothetical protein BCR36DRAFT_365483 [Piromyces finnis]|uniref:Uncharacterized protein n=1 Tax=Piromyces finnis TaxID=1754191 RepID=A0A1Y1VP13_9FUNG|nr:hypothetical protein BCR36DRAFT_365483 [Piromyces finnis]|eukprot:ORX60893.1 hypothetical protein BCR36DRAFT_365483 [Piromyces finnis]
MKLEILYGLYFLKKRGYRKILIPLLMKSDVMTKTAQLSDVDEELYMVSKVNDNPEPKCNMFGVKKMNSHVKNYVYLLNGTLCVNGRTFFCTLENYQTENVLIVPELLRPYIDVVKFICQRTHF